jgi:hypothetical protein
VNETSSTATLDPYSLRRPVTSMTGMPQAFANAAVTTSPARFDLGRRRADGRHQPIG